MINFLEKNTKIRISNGKIVIPENTKHIKIDIGLSYSAPHSQVWLEKEEDLCVFGFEPHPESINSILSGAVKRHPSHGKPLETKYIDNGFNLIPCALSSFSNNIKLYSTPQDIGCSSIFEPINTIVNKIYEVPCFTLVDFFEIFPFDDFPIIEYIKIDAQGSDLDIIKGGKDYISKYVVIITIEPENDCYKNTVNSFDDIVKYMTSINFSLIETTQAKDPTFVNNHFLDMPVYFEQNS